MVLLPPRSEGRPDGQRMCPEFGVHRCPPGRAGKQRGAQVTAGHSGSAKAPRFSRLLRALLEREAEECPL